MTKMLYQCVSGAPADEHGVCLEHGEAACVIGVPLAAKAETEPDDELPDLVASEPTDEAGLHRPPAG